MTRADLTQQVNQAIEMSRKESDVVVCAIFDGIVRALRSGDKVGTQSKNRSPSRSATEENYLFQTEQRTSRTGR